MSTRRGFLAAIGAVFAQAAIADSPFTLPAPRTWLHVHFSEHLSPGATRLVLSYQGQRSDNAWFTSMIGVDLHEMEELCFREIPGYQDAKMAALITLNSFLESSCTCHTGHWCENHREITAPNYVVTALEGF